MAGTIFGLPLSQQFLENGEPMSGGKLYLYEAGTSTPVTAYEDFGLTSGLELSHPIILDSGGRIPEFWVDDGSYRVRLTDADGNEIFDINSTTALGASSGSGGGGGESVAEASLHQTGDMIWQPVSGTRTGWVRANARTIGSASSGATERANADCETLFLFLWNTFSNTFCPVTGGRGGSAAADWAANKVIATLDMRRYGAIGLNDMGNSSASFTGGSTTAADILGASTFTIAQANLPNVSLSSTALAVASTHVLTVGTSITNGSSVGRGTLAAASASGALLAFTGSGTSDTLSLASSVVSGTITSTLTGTIPLGGSGSALNILPPSRAGTWYIRL